MIEENFGDMRKSWGNRVVKTYTHLMEHGSPHFPERVSGLFEIHIRVDNDFSLTVPSLPGVAPNAAIGADIPEVTLLWVGLPPYKNIPYQATPEKSEIKIFKCLDHEIWTPVRISQTLCYAADGNMRIGFDFFVDIKHTR